METNFETLKTQLNAVCCNSLNNYLTTLMNYGYKGAPETIKLVVYLFLVEFLTEQWSNLTEEQRLTIQLFMDKFYDTGCIISGPSHCE